MSKELMTITDPPAPLSPQRIKDQIATVEGIRKTVMHEGVHYGTIPGTDRPALLKAGAEKLGLAFGLRARFAVDLKERDGGHREYTVTCELADAGGNFVAEGIGVASTMESKYRYRWTSTGRPVPQSYWDSRDPVELGGEQYRARKIDNNWEICERGENLDPADVYNTVAKMAKKRAHVDATITALAVGDMFDQDIDDEGPKPEPAKAKPRARATAKAQTGSISDAQLKVLRAEIGKHGKTDEAALCAKFKVDKLEALEFDDLNDALEFARVGK